jgi:hypothetical protein
MNIDAVEYLKKLISYRSDASLSLVEGLVKNAPREALYIDCHFSYHTNRKVFKDGVWVDSSKAEQEQLMGSLIRLNDLVENIRAIQRLGGIQCAKRIAKLKGGYMGCKFEGYAEIKQAIKDYNAVYDTKTIEEVQETINITLKYLVDEIERCKQTERNKELPSSMRTQAFVIRERLQKAEELLKGGAA